MRVLTLSGPRPAPPPVGWARSPRAPTCRRWVPSRTRSARGRGEIGPHSERRRRVHDRRDARLLPLARRVTTTTPPGAPPSPPPRSRRRRERARDLRRRSRAPGGRGKKKEERLHVRRRAGAACAPRSQQHAHTTARGGGGPRRRAPQPSLTRLGSGVPRPPHMRIRPGTSFRGARGSLVSRRRLLSLGGAGAV